MAGAAHMPIRICRSNSFSFHLFTFFGHMHRGCIFDSSLCRPHGAMDALRSAAQACTETPVVVERRSQTNNCVGRCIRSRENDAAHHAPKRLVVIRVYERPQRAFGFWCVCGGERRNALIIKHCWCFDRFLKKLSTHLPMTLSAWMHKRRATARFA